MKLPVVRTKRLWSWPDCEPECTRCGAELTRVFDGEEDVGQYNGALELSLNGGYGMYFDNPRGNTKHTVLCKDCADLLLEAMPFLQEIVAS